jgi:YD repeat-containing protein
MGRENKMPSKIRHGFLISLVFISLVVVSVSTSYADTTNYVYDELNRLIRVEYGDGRVYEYIYDRAGNRLEIMINALIPAAPTNLRPTFISLNQINLGWTDNSNDETGFKIERKIGAGGTYVQIGTVGADTTAYPDTNLTSGTIYYYKVRAYNGSGNSAYSAEVTIKTLTYLGIWELVPGASPSSPALAWNPATNKLHMVVRGGGNTIWTATFTSEGAFNDDWTPLPGNTAAGPGVAYNPVTNRLHIVVIGTDNTLWEMVY